MNSPLLTIAMLALFGWLAYTSQKDVPLDTKGLARLVEESKPLTRSQRQAMALQSIYHISTQEISQPVRLFGEK